jgi:hypothetical protein
MCSQKKKKKKGRITLAVRVLPVIRLACALFFFRGNFSIHEVPPELQCENAEAQSLAVVIISFFF